MRLGRLLAENKGVSDDQVVPGVKQQIVNCSDLLHTNFTTNFSATVDTSEDPIVVINCTTYNHHGNNTLLSSSSGDGLDPGNIIIWTLSSFVSLLCCYTFFRPSRPSLAVRRMEMQRERVRQLEELRKDPDWQKRVMARTLVTKEVLSFDEKDQSFTLGDVDEDGSVGESLGEQSLSLVSVESNEDTSRCIICLEAFRVGDRVTFPFGDIGCCHVFHTQCILSWFEKHNDCPSCRSVLLQLGEDEELLEVDADDLEIDPEDDEAMNASSSAFVIVGGLIRKATRRASSCFIGTSIDVESGEAGGPSALRRTLSGGYSLERRPSFLRVALRRISSYGLYSRLSQNFDEDAFDDLDDEEDSLEETEIGLKRPKMLKRTLSEGASGTGHRRKGFFEQVGLRRVSSSGGYTRVAGASLHDEEDEIELAASSSRSGTVFMSDGEDEEDDLMLNDSSERSYNSVKLARRVSFEDQRMREHQLAQPPMLDAQDVAASRISPELLKPIRKMSEDERRFLSVRSPTILEEVEDELEQSELQV